MDKMTLTSREKNYIKSFITYSDEDTNESDFKVNYDLNYRLKKKFLQLHDDYWNLVDFFRNYDQKIQRRTTEQTQNTILKAKSQIKSLETLFNTKCYYCKGTDKKMLEINICTECKANLGF